MKKTHEYLGPDHGTLELAEFLHKHGIYRMLADDDGRAVLVIEHNQGLSIVNVGDTIWVGVGETDALHDWVKVVP